MPLNSSIKVNWVWIFITLTSVIAGLILFSDVNRPQHYLLLPVLPFAYGIINIVSIVYYNYIYKNIGVSLVLGFYYIRTVLVPVIMSFGNYESLLKLNITQNMDYGITIMIYELVVVYLVMLIYITKRKKNKTVVRDNGIESGRTLKILIILIFSILAFDIAVWMTIPESRLLYGNIFETLNKSSSQIVSIDNIAARGDFKRVFLTLYSITVEIIRIMVPAYFLIIIRKKFGEKLSGIIASIPFILIQFFLVSNTHARSIMCVFILILLIAKLYPTWSKKLYLFSILIGCLFILFYFYYRYSIQLSSSTVSSLTQNASKWANAYFSGPDNIAAMFNVMSEDKWSVLWYTLINSIPFNGTLFAISGSNYSSLYNTYNGSQFQIGPLIAESYFFIGAILSPIIPSLVTILTVHYGNKAHKESDIWRYIAYTYFTLLLAMSLVLYNGTILLKTFMSLILPLLIISKLSNKKRSTL